jgi:hypothetical protein
MFRKNEVPIPLKDPPSGYLSAIAMGNDIYIQRGDLKEDQSAVYRV